MSTEVSSEFELQLQPTVVLGKLIDNSEYHNGSQQKAKQSYPSQDQYVIGLQRPGTQL